MKKAVSVLLSLILACSCFVGVFTFTAQAESVELINNGDFETLTLNPLHANYGAVAFRNTTDAKIEATKAAVNGGQWLRGTAGSKNYSDLGDIVACNAEDGTVTKALATEYPTHVSGNSVTILQPDDGNNHIARVHQNIYQAIDLVSENTYAFRFKIRMTGTKTFWIRLASLINDTANNRTSDSTISKMKLDVLSCSGATYASGSTAYGSGIDGACFTVAETNTWYDVTVIATVEDFAPTTNKVLIPTDYTLFSIHTHAGSRANTTSTTDGYYYLNTYMMLDDISVKQYADPIGAPAFYNNNGLIKNANDAATVTATVGGQATDIVCVGDEVTATVNYDTTSGAYQFRGWFDEDNVLVSTDPTITFTATTDKVYTPRIISKNLIESASFEGYAVGDDLQVASNTTPPSADKWGFMKNAGYYGATFADTVVGVDGTVYTVSASGSSGTHASPVVTTAEAHTGNQAMAITANWPAIRAFSVAKNTNYTLSFWYRSGDTAAITGAAIVTTYNWGTNGKPTYVDADKNVKSLSAVQTSLANDMYNNPRIVTKVGGNITGATYADGWKQVSYAFNSADLETLYLLIKGNSQTLYIDDITLVNNDATDDSYALETKLVDTKGNAVTNANIYAKASAFDYGDGVSVASVAYDATSGGYAFAGWVDADGKVLSTDERYLFATAGEKPIAKIISRNLLESASFEGYEAGTSLEVTKDATAGTADAPNGDKWGFIKNSGYYGRVWQGSAVGKDGTVYTYDTTDGNFDTDTRTILVNDTTAKSGNHALCVSFNYRSAIRKLAVAQDTDYVLSFWYRSQTGSIVSAGITTAYNVGAGADNTATTVPDIILANDITGSKNFTLSGSTITDTSVTDGWQRASYIFNSGDFEELYLLIKPVNTASTVTYLDDMVLMEYEQATLSTDDMKNCASVDLVDATADTLYIGQNVQFRVVDNMEAAPVVKHNGTVLTADANGIYSFIATAENALSVRFAGDEELLWAHKDALGRALNANNHAVYSEDIWAGDTVYHETALFTSNKDTVKLLYPVDTVVSLRSYSLAINYVEGYDYEITADGEIKRLDSGRIPVYTGKLTSETKDNDYYVQNAAGDGYIAPVADTTHAGHAVSVTYTHTETFADGYQPSAPASQYAALNNVIAKLENGEAVNIVVYGDSISCGWSSSGLNLKKEEVYGSEKDYIINMPPYAPTWIEMLMTELKAQYPNADINLKNLALGGKQSGWGAAEIANRLALWTDGDTVVTPDLMLVGFGVNDSNSAVSQADFKANMQSIIDTARSASGNATMEVLMYSPMLPNQSGAYWPAERLLGYETAMEEIAAGDLNVGLVKLTSIFNQIVKSKASEDYLSTNINHGNDFTARVYYNAIAAAFNYDTALDTLPAGNAVFNAVGVSMRKEGEIANRPQALRFKLQLARAELDATYAGYQITEYGAVVGLQNKVGTVLDLDDVAAGKAVKGVAYSKANGTETLYAQTDTTNTYTMALYNIGAVKNAGTGEVTSINYSKWATVYLARAYAVYEAEGKPAVVVYGDVTLEGNVFGTIQEILDNGSQSDQDYINNTLFVNQPESKTAYDSWKASAAN